MNTLVIALLEATAPIAAHKLAALFNGRQPSEDEIRAELEKSFIEVAKQSDISEEVVKRALQDMGETGV